MGVISRKIFPACVNMCVCCPALRSRSRQPVKRYKKLLAEIFPKSPDGSANERKIAKLCEYAAKNPFRIPKIAKYLEERCYKELRCGHVKLVSVVTEVYYKLLCMCKEQMAYFAVNLLHVAIELLDNSKRDAIQIIGCQTLTRFIYSQVDATYTYNIENLVHKVCVLASGAEEEHRKSCLRASGLQCLSAMVWFMTEFSHIFIGFDEIVNATLDSYERDTHCEEDDARGEPHHNWVDEVVRYEGKGAGTENSSSFMIIRPRPETKDPSLLTREEVDMPKVWAQICIQKMVQLAKESTTMRRVLDPIFVYFDTRQQWVPNGLAFIVLSDMAYFMETPGNRQLILAAVVRHLDHKNVSHDPEVKSHVIHTASALARQIRSGAFLSDIGFVSDLCRHLRKSLQATVESVGEHELNLNITLQSSIEDCLLEIAKGIADARALFDMMAITLEKLPSARVVARATIGSLIILAHMFSLAPVPSNSLVFPEGLLVQLLKVMMHPDVEVRVGGHQIFSTLLIPSSNRLRFDASVHTRRWHSSTASAFASITALLEKLRKEKDGNKVEKHGFNSQTEFMERDNAEEEKKQAWARKNSPNFHNISSIIDRTAGTNSFSEEPSIMKFSEDQITQLISAFWMQANLPDNLPSNIEAIAHSFCLTLISLRLENPKDSGVVRFFQLPLSLWKKSLDPSNGMLSPANQRSLLVLSTAMLLFAAKIYQIPDMDRALKPLLESDVDPYLAISCDYQVYVKPQKDVKEYGSANDNQVAASQLIELQSEIYESEKIMLEILVECLSGITELAAYDISMQLLETFTPDDAFVYGPQMLDLDPMLTIQHSKESSFDGDFPINSLVDDDVISESSVAGISRFIPKMSPPSSLPHIISIGQLLESALEVAGQVAGTSLSTSPLPFSAMAGQCEALGTDSRKKLSTWLSHENRYTKSANILFTATPADGRSTITKIMGGGGPLQGAVPPTDPWLALRLPPASPFDNFLRAARH